LKTKNFGVLPRGTHVRWHSDFRDVLSEIGVRVLQRGFEVVRFIDEEGCLLDLLFLADFTERQHSELRGSGLKQPRVEEFIGLRIDGVHESEALVQPNRTPMPF
jgi:hypothetical protein